MEGKSSVTPMKSHGADNQAQNWDLSDFFPENIDQSLEPEVHVVEIPYTRKGRRLKIKLRELTGREIEDIRAAHTKQVLMRDEKGKLIYRGRVPIRETIADEVEIGRHMLAEAFVFPDLKDTDLQLKYGAAGHIDLFEKMFPQNKISSYIAQKFNEIQSAAVSDMDDDEEAVTILQEAAKN